MDTETLTENLIIKSGSISQAGWTNAGDYGWFGYLAKPLVAKPQADIFRELYDYALQCKKNSTQ